MARSVDLNGVRVALAFLKDDSGTVRQAVGSHAVGVRTTAADSGGAAASNSASC